MCNVKCQVNWIGDTGSPTPDDNAAIGECWCEWDAKRRFPICADHAKRLTRPSLLNAGWQFKAYPVMLVSMASYFTILLPPIPEGHIGRTEWHDTERLLTRGSFKTIEEAHAWANDHVRGCPYGVLPINDEETLTVKLTGTEVV